MALPMILIFERHWDTIPKQVLKKLITKLSDLGYDSLCLERPNDLTIYENIEHIQATIDYSQKQLEQVYSYLDKAGVRPKNELSTLPFADLWRLLALYVSSQRYFEVAEMIKNLPGHAMLTQIINDALHQKMSVFGVDIEEKEYSTIVEQGMDTRMKALDKSANKRNINMYFNLVQHYQQRKGVIFLGGALHSKAIYEKLKKNISEDQIHVYLPHSAENINPKGNDFETLLNHEVLVDRKYLLKTEADMDAFIEKIEADIEASNIHTISHHPESCSHAELLAAEFKQSFEVHLRQSYKADARLEITAKVNAEAIAEKCKQHHIPTRFHLFKNKKYLIIEDINTREVAENIRKLGAS